VTVSRGQPDEPPAAELPPDTGPTVVGIGASAGGLAALRRFFSHVPAQSGIAWVVVVPLSPEHRSALDDLLQPHVKLPVSQVTETVPLEPDRVYVLPPGAHLEAIDTHLRLSPLEEERGLRAPVDHFFRMLARTHDGNSVGVILTGAGADGSLGIKALKERNGFTVVQDPAEAEHAGMPQSAISTGMVDEVLRLDDIAAAVLRFARARPRLGGAAAADRRHDREQQRLLRRVLSHVRARTGREFAGYRHSTVLRRLQRRMQIREVGELADYVELLRSDAAETRQLADDLLIPVTSFFRDPEIWAALRKQVVPRLFDAADANEGLRVWSAGCATGEEAYSLAMLLLEEAARRLAPAPIQVFASDLHAPSLERARDGFYPGDIGADVSAERLRRFFHREDGGYRIRKTVRERVIFAPHDFLTDPPFSRLDLIACRNVLIYLQRDVHPVVLAAFHYALRPGGYLVLGNDETVEDTELFRLAGSGHHLYRRQDVRGRQVRVPLPSLHRPRIIPEAGRGSVLNTDPDRPLHLHLDLLEEFVSPSIVVAPDGRVLHLSEHAGRFMRHSGGLADMNAVRLVREELRLELRTALHAARRSGERTRSQPIPVRMGAEQVAVTLDVRPARGPRHDGYVLVVFDEAPAVAIDRPHGLAYEGANAGAAQSIERRLDRSEGRLHALIQDYERSQEELRASNEELQSANEELRSTLEELETSREELHSINEELQNANEENRQKVEELAQLATDLQNLLASTEIATLFLDREMRILRFTPGAAELFNVRTDDRGRPLADLTNRLGYEELGDDAAQVLGTLVPVEREVEDELGRWYLTRVLPYRSGEDRIDGVVITFLDITGRKRAERSLLVSEERHRLIVESALDYAIFTLDSEGRIETWTPGAEAVFGWRAEDVIGRSPHFTYTPQDRAEGVVEAELRSALADGVAPDVRWHVRRDDTRVFIDGVVRVIADPEAGTPRGFLKIGQDMTERRQMEDSLRDLNQTLEQKVAARTAALERESAARREVLRRLVTTEEEERKRISRELHDRMGQHLTGLLLGLRSAQHEAGSSPLTERLRKLEQLARETASDVQSMAVELRPPALDALGLVAALENHLEDWSGRHGIEHDFHARALDEVRLSREVEITLYRVVQEALTNVLKHASATRVDLILERREGTVRLVLEDNGRGFDVDRALAVSTKDRRLGVRGMQERVALLGGELEIESSPGHGATLYVRVPVLEVDA
jgi:two-component system, chemotaxis family, CheB/CheR fusion protein